MEDLWDNWDYGSMNVWSYIDEALSNKLSDAEYCHTFGDDTFMLLVKINMNNVLDLLKHIALYMFDDPKGFWMFYGTSVRLRDDFDITVGVL